MGLVVVADEPDDAPREVVAVGMEPLGLLADEDAVEIELPDLIGDPLGRLSPQVGEAAGASQGRLELLDRLVQDRGERLGGVTSRRRVALPG